MSPALLIPLVVLALIDSTSVGTLLVPVWLLLASGRPQPGKIVLYLGTVTVFYLFLGLLLLMGVLSLSDEIAALLESRVVRRGQLLLGVCVIVLGVVIEPWTKEGKAKKQAKREARRRAKPGWLTRIRDEINTGGLSSRAVVGLALGATAIEAASMLPYLAAIGLLAASGIAGYQAGLVLVGYCLVMISPAMILLGLRITFHDRVAPALQRLDGWMSRHAGEAAAWLVFLVGVYLTSDAAQALRGP